MKAWSETVSGSVRMEEVLSRTRYRKPKGFVKRIAGDLIIFVKDEETGDGLALINNKDGTFRVQYWEE